MISLEYEFDAELWRWPAKDTWFFITLPLADVTEEIKFFHQNRRGFGSLRVEVTCGDSTWRTSIFPDKRAGSFVLPVKAAIRNAEGISAGDTARFRLRVIDEPM